MRADSRRSALAAFLLATTTLPLAAQQEVYHPGETYDSLQAGQDAYGDAEAQRRALIGRQLLLEEQIMRQNTWADPQDRYRPVRPDSYGPIAPRTYFGPTLADVYAYPRTGVVLYNGRVISSSAPVAVVRGEGRSTIAAPVPVFEPWPRVPNDIYGTPYYGYVRQPIGHVKIWTGRLSYIYKPIYASPPTESPRPTSETSPRSVVPPGQLPVRPQVPPATTPVPPPPAPGIPPVGNDKSRQRDGQDASPLGGKEI